MVTDNDDILSDADGDEAVSNGDLDVGDGTLDDCFIIFGLNAGVLTREPLLAPEIIGLINKSDGDVEMKQRLSLALRMDGKTASKLDIVDGNIDFEIS